jgi:hypothetical protein
MNSFFEQILKASPYLQEEIEKLRQWWREQVFQPGGLVSSESDSISGFFLKGESQEAGITTGLLDFNFSPVVVVHSEEEMIQLSREEGDRFLRTDLNYVMVFIGGDPSDRNRYLRVLAQIELAETVGEALVFPMGEEAHRRSPLSCPSLPESYERQVVISLSQMRSAAAQIWMSGEVPASVFEPPISLQQETIAPQIIYPGECKFYSGIMEIRCAVNPCAPSCDGCVDFERKIPKGD